MSKHYTVILQQKRVVCVRLLACIVTLQFATSTMVLPHGHSATFQKKPSKPKDITPTNQQPQTSAPQNVSILQDMSSPAQNTNALSKINDSGSSGKRNTALGVNALHGLTDGSNNVAVGKDAGKILETGSYNIYISSDASSIDESGTIRFGTNGRQEKCYIAGITGVTPSGSTETVIINANGQLGSTASGTGGSSASYGQLSIAAQNMYFYTADEWLPVKFSSTGPSSNMDVSTTVPATITIQNNGVYQIGFSVYFSVEDADEHTFNIATYTLGLAINGVTAPIAAVYSGEPGYFSLNYSNIIEFSAGDTVQFYMKASNADTPPFANHVSLEDGNAYLVQIAN